MDVVAWGLDYVRYKVGNRSGVDHIATRFPYVDIKGRWYHGALCVDLPGSALELIRMFAPLDDEIESMARTFPVTRLDVFIDVEGYHVDDMPQPGTVIKNDGRIETVYSHHLASRGNHPAFARCYDAQAAGHYDVPVTRFECEFKQEISRGILDSEGWNIDPVSVAMWHIHDIFGVEISIPGKRSTEFNPPKRRYSHSRERFYARYGKNILLDLEQMGKQRLYQFIMECISSDNKDE